MKRIVSFLLVFSFFIQIFPLSTFTNGVDVIENETHLMQLNTGAVIENDVSLMQFNTGDLNWDGFVDEADLTILSKHVARIKLIEDENLLNNADINSDGSVNAEDLTELSSYMKINNNFMIKEISVNISESVVGSVFEWTVNSEGGHGHVEYFFELNRVKSTESFSLEGELLEDIVVSSECYSLANYFCVNIMEPGEYSINVYCRDEIGNICSAKNVSPITALSQELRVVDVTANSGEKVFENTPIVWTIRTEGGRYPLVYTYTLIYNNTEICTYSSDMNSYTLDSCNPGEYQLKIECVDSDNNTNSYLSEKITVYSESVLDLSAPKLSVLNKDFFLAETELDAAKFEVQSLLLEWDEVFGAEEYGIELSYKNSGEWFSAFSVENLTSCKYTLPQELFRASISEKLFRIGVYSKGIATGDIRYYYFCMYPVKFDSSINVNNSEGSTWDIATSNKVSRYFYVDSALDYSVSADVDWITIVKGIDGFFATVSENSEHVKTRSGTIMIDNGENIMKIFVNQGDGQGAPELLYPHLSSDEKQPTARPVGGITLEFKEYYANYVGVRIYEISALENNLVYEKIVPRKVDFLHIPNENEGYEFKANTVYKIELSGHYSTACNENEIGHDVERNSFYVYMMNDGHNILVEGSSHYEYRGYGNVTVNLYSTNTWTYSTDVDWIHVEDYELVACYQDIEKIDIKLDPNYTENTRTGIATFYCGEKTATVKIIQESLYPRFIYPDISQDMSKPTILPSSGLVIGTVYENATYATYSNGLWSGENGWGSSSLGYYTLIPDNTYTTDVLYRFTLKSGEQTSVYYAKFKADSSKNYVLLRDPSLGEVIDLNINAPAGKTTHDIKMKANANWKIESNVSWLSSSSTSGSKSTSWKTLTITAQANNTGRARTGVLSFKIGDTVCATLTVTQPLGDCIELFEKDDIWGYIHYDSETSFKLCDGSGDSKRLYAWANSTWGAESHSSWITINGKTSVNNIQSGKYIDIELKKNTTNSIRTGTVTVFCGNKSQVITITQVPGMEFPTLVSPKISTDYKNPSSVKYGDINLIWNAVKGAKYYTVEVVPSDRDILLPDSSFYSFITEVKDTGHSTYSCVIPKTAFSLNMETYDYIYIRAYDEYGYYVYDSFYFISSLSDVARINGSTSPIWNNATDIEVSKEFVVTSTGDWYAESKSEWITIDKTNGINGDILTVSLSENKGSARSGQVIITVGNTKTVLTVNQCAYLPEFPSVFSPEFSDGIGTPTVISSEINSITVKWDSAPQVEYYKVELLSYKTHGSKHVEAESPMLRKGETHYEFTGLNLQPGQVYILSISQKSHWGYTGHNYYFTPNDESAWVLVEDEPLIDYELECDEDCVRVDIESSGVWTASTDTDWIMIDSEHITKEKLDKIGVDSLYYSDYSGNSGGDMYISVLANPDNTYRYGTITVRSGGAEATIEISQSPYYEIAEIYSPALAEKRVDSVGLPYGDITFRWDKCVGGSGTYQIILEEREEGSTYKYYDILEETGITKTRYTIPASVLKEGGYYCLKLCSDISGINEDSSPCKYYYFHVKYKNELTVSADINWDLTSNDKMVMISASATGGAGGYRFSYEILCNGDQIAMSELGTLEYYTFPIKEIGKYQVRVYCRDAAGVTSQFICNEYSVNVEDLDYIKTSISQWTAGISNESKELIITSNDSWIVKLFPEWVSCSTYTGNSGNSLILSVGINSGEDRSGVVVIASGKSECFITINQLGVVGYDPIITYPMQDSEVDFSDILLKWERVDYADSYLISLRDLTVNNLLMYHEQTETETYNIPVSYFTNGHQYRVAIGANVGGRIWWSERIFTVKALSSSKCTDLFGYVLSSKGNPVEGACVYIYTKNDKTLVCEITTDSLGTWNVSGLHLDTQYSIEILSPDYRFDSQFFDINVDSPLKEPILIKALNSLDNETSSLIDCEIVESGLSFSSEASDKELFINASGSWSVKCDVDWITLSSYSGIGSQAIIVSVDENTTFLNDFDYRSAEIVIIEENSLVENFYKQDSFFVFQDEPIKKVYVAYSAGESFTSNIFDERTGKYNGMELEPNTSYSFSSSKKIIIDKPMYIPEGTTVSIKGELFVKAEVIFASPKEYTEGLGIYQRKKIVHSRLECDSLTVNSKGILNMNNGGYIYVDGDFNFDSSHDHSLYLQDGTIEVTGGVFLKDKFYPSGNNTVILSGNRVHNVSVKDQWFENDMYFNNLEIDNIIYFKTKDIFDCIGPEKDRFDIHGWFLESDTAIDYLSIDFMSGDRPKGSEADRIIKNMNYALFDLMVRNSKLLKKHSIMGIFDLLSEGEGVTYSYIDENNEFIDFTVGTVWSTGIGSTLAAGWFTYQEDSGPIIQFMVGTIPEELNTMVENGYGAIVRHAAESLIEGYSDLVTGMFNLELATYISKEYSDLYRKIETPMTFMKYWVKIVKEPVYKNYIKYLESK